MQPHLRTLTLVALAVVAAACGGAAPPSSLTGSPSAQLSPTPSAPGSTAPVTPSGTASTTLEPSPVPPDPTVSPTPQTTAGEIDHPTDPTTAILRAEHVGGFMMIGHGFARRPYFTLYGDGTVVYRPLAEPNPDPGAPFQPMQVARMSEDQIQALLRFALGPGRLLNAKPSYFNPLIADAPDTVFTLAAGEFSRKVQVTAINEDSDQLPDRADIEGFRQLDALLADFGMQVAEGRATAAGPYVPTSYTGMLFANEATPETKDWPWPELTAANLVPGPGEFSGLLVALTPAQVKKLVAVPNGGLIGYQVRGPDKKAYILSIRPDLPEDPPLGTDEPLPSASPAP
ncbi:MAG: hypothetical protein H0W07_10125 [Chloroflexi bacterium]|nr:hypothetical protein [Chloroflexota bacterium]